jgi:hypothetical protein
MTNQVGRVLRSAATAVLMVLVMWAPASADEKDPRAMSPDEFSAWITYFYRAPEPGMIPAYIDKVHAEKLYQNDDTVMPTIGFLAARFALEPQAVEPALTQAAGLSKGDHVMTALAAYLGSPSGSPQHQTARRVLQDVDGWNTIQWMADGGVRHIDDVDPLVPASLDFLWAAFFATGDVKYVDAIIPTLRHLQSKQPAEVVIGITARWGMRSNAQQHPLVLEECRKQVGAQPPQIADALREIVAKAQGGAN